MTDTPLAAHSLERTSPKGQPFIGYCVNCGTINLPAKAALEECPNPEGVTQDQALVEAVKRDATR
jgi:hypothetical protein